MGGLGSGRIIRGIQYPFKGDVWVVVSFEVEVRGSLHY